MKIIGFIEGEEVIEKALKLPGLRASEARSSFREKVSSGVIVRIEYLRRRDCPWRKVKIILPAWLID